jgi:hypothetical protein
MIDSPDVIASFVDGERVDASQLAAALADADGRQYLVDVLALRDLVETQSLAAAPVTARRSPGTAARWLWGAAAASAVLIAGAAGYATGARQAERTTVVSPGIAAAVRADIRLPAPAPTRVIKLESGVNWHEEIGGH